MWLDHITDDHPKCRIRRRLQRSATLSHRWSLPCIRRQRIRSNTLRRPHWGSRSHGSNCELLIRCTALSSWCSDWGRYHVQVTFKLSSAVDDRYISTGLLLTLEEGETKIFDIVYTGSSKYIIKNNFGLYLGDSSLGLLLSEVLPTYYRIFRVTYHV